MPFPVIRQEDVFCGYRGRDAGAGGRRRMVVGSGRPMAAQGGRVPAKNKTTPKMGVVLTLKTPVANV